MSRGAPAIVILGNGSLNTARRIQQRYPQARIHGLAQRVVPAAVDGGGRAVAVRRPRFGEEVVDDAVSAAEWVDAPVRDLTIARAGQR